MITKEALQEAIAECQGTRNPNRETCMMLAAFYTIQDHLYPEPEERTEDTRLLPQSYSYSAPPEQSGQVRYHSGTEFSAVVDGMETDKVMATMDELMTTLKIINERLYDGVLRQLQD